MGFFNSLLGAVAPIAGSLLGGPVGGAIGGAVGGLLGSKDAPKSQTATTQQQLDPRIQSMLFGDGTSGNQGLLAQYQALGNTPQNAQMAQYGKDAQSYLGNYNQDTGAIRNAATGLLTGQQAPQAQAAQAQVAGQNGMAYNVGNMVNAPAQNNMNLSGAYDKFINGDAGANPYLTNAIQGGINQSTNQFRQMQGEATDNLMRNVMPSIRSNSVLSGQYGGSRQGVAEGNAISDFTKQQNQAATQFGQNNTNAAVGSQAQAYNQGQDRALSATQGLGAQQYGVASQDAATKNAAEFANVAATNAIKAQGVANQNQMNMYNAGNQQQTNLANAGFQQSTNALNQNGVAQGSAALNGLLNGAAQTGQYQDNYALNRAGQTNSLLSPYMSANGSTTSSQPLYQNTTGNMLGGAMAGLGLYNQFAGGQPTNTSNSYLGTWK